MIKLINHEAKLAKATQLMKVMFAAAVAMLVVANPALANEFTEDTGRTIGEKIEPYWDYGVRWLVMAVFFGLAIGNFINEQKWKLNWIVAVILAIVIGGFGKDIFLWFAG